jgi:hypothetical protein
VLAVAGESCERRRQRVHPVYEKLELLATRANQVWSWDITKSKGPVQWRVYHLYVILDIFSRYVVGWMVALREAAELAEQLIADTIANATRRLKVIDTLRNCAANYCTNSPGKNWEVYGPVGQYRCDLDLDRWRLHNVGHASVICARGSGFGVAERDLPIKYRAGGASGNGDRGCSAATSHY